MNYKFRIETITITITIYNSINIQLFINEFILHNYLSIKLLIIIFIINVDNCYRYLIFLNDMIGNINTN